MSKPWIFICPASRGIGHALTRHLLKTTNLPILATTHRTDPEQVRSSILSGSPSSSSFSSRLNILPLDVTSEPSVRSASDRAAEIFPNNNNNNNKNNGGKEVSSSSSSEQWHMHLAFALPGILPMPPEKSPGRIDYEKALETFKVNTLGQMLLMKWFGERFLPKKNKKNSAAAAAFNFPPPPSAAEEEGKEEGKKKILKISPSHATYLAASARVGSTSDNKSGGWYSYRASKAGVINLVKGFDLFLGMRSGVTAGGGKGGEGREGGGSMAMAMAYHPGTVKTDLSREFWDHAPPGKLFTPEYAAERMAEIVSLEGTGAVVGGGGDGGMRGRGRCWDWKGSEVLP